MEVFFKTYRIPKLSLTAPKLNLTAAEIPQPIYTSAIDFFCSEPLFSNYLSSKRDHRLIPLVFPIYNYAYMSREHLILQILLKEL